MVVVIFMVVIRVIGSCRNIHGCALWLGHGPKGPALMVVLIFMDVIRVIGSL